jgi:hypothetical protein
MIFHDVSLSLLLSTNIQVWLQFTGSAKMVDKVLCSVKSIQVLVTIGCSFTKQKIYNKVTKTVFMCDFHYKFLFFIVIYCNCSLGFLWHFTVMFWKSWAICITGVNMFTQMKYNINMHSSPVWIIDKTIVVRAIMCSGMVQIYQCFRGTCCLHLHGGRVKMEAALSS